MADDYDRMRRLFVVFTVERGIVPGSDIDPVRNIEILEARGMGLARKGLRMAIGDIVESLANAGADRVAALETRLREAGAMSLAEARLLFSRRLKTVVKRGRIIREEEYYLVRNAVEAAAEPERAALWDLLAAYEYAGE